MTRLEKQVDISLLTTITTDQDRTCPVQLIDNDLIVVPLADRDLINIDGASGLLRSVGAGSGVLLYCQPIPER